MPEICPPKYVMRSLAALRSRGYEAYLVGGCVRDMLLARRPNDWDICTSALPEEIMSVFPRSEPTGIEHGTVTVHSGSGSMEVTTFRSESAYSDHRHPDRVTFVRELETDLRRRDFTVNAIAMDVDMNIIDPFNGRSDIENRLIRCVGEPLLRFDEDALRMLRAFRFCAKLGFALEGETASAIAEKAFLASALTPERVRDELEGMLLSDRPECAFQCAAAGLLRDLLPPSAVEGVEALSSLPKNALMRWAGFAYIALPSSGAELLSSLRLDAKTVQCAGAVCELLSEPFPKTDAGIKRALNSFPTEAVECAARLSLGRGGLTAVRRVLRSGECRTLRELCVSGNDLAAIGFSGREIGTMLKKLLEHVIEQPEDNRRELLLALAINGRNANE